MDASIASTFSSLRRTRNAGLALCACLLVCLAVGAQSERANPQARPEPRETSRLAHPVPSKSARAEIFFCETNSVQCRTKINEFGIDDVRDLFVFSAWRNLSGEHIQQLRFLLPDGNTYQKIDTKFTVEEIASSPEVQVAVRTREEKAVSTPFAVAGTHITQRSLSGQWTVELYLDGKFMARTNLVFKPRDSQ